DAREKARAAGMHVPDTLEEAVLGGPEADANDRVVWQMLKAGEVTNTSLLNLAEIVGPRGATIIDAANSHPLDTDMWAEEFQRYEIPFLGIGVSGGVIARHQGYPLMVGGDEDAYQRIRPILDSAARPGGGHDYFGPGGFGHWVKAVHNAIEYPYMQGLGEGAGVLEKLGIDPLKAFRLYQKGSLISGFMMDRAVDTREEDPDLSSFSGKIGSASGEAVWVVEYAEKHDLPVESIKQAIGFRQRSETDPQVRRTTAAKQVAALRKSFGGHEVELVSS
ncbi:MAG: NAD(P)-binding domain-containing protein, partial [Patescibacteria group bacterium]